MDYLRQCRHVGTICYVMHSKGQQVAHDHIAFRTLRDDRVGIDRLADYWLRQGYEQAGELDGPNWHARHYRHPDRPKIFISELDQETLSRPAQALLGRLLDHVPGWWVKQDGFCYAGRLWPLSFTDYQVLAEESEYAAWFAALGFRAHHFALDVGQTSMTLPELVDVVKLQGVPMNMLQGTAGLQECETKADRQLVEFTDGWGEIPTCGYEFIQRQEVDGELFQGFNDAGVLPAN